LVCAVPMVGFGFMDNTIMIHAGDIIDEHVGLYLGLSTLASAAMGQVLSDFSGVCFGGSIEAAASKLGLPHPDFSASQRHLPSVKFVGTAGAAIGVLVGCIFGMTNLLFLDLGKVERQKNQESLHGMFRSYAMDGPDFFEAERCTLYLMDKDRQHLWTIAVSWHFTTPQILEFMESLRQDVDWEATAVGAYLKKQYTAEEVKKTFSGLDFDDAKERLDEVQTKGFRQKLKKGGTKHEAVVSRQVVNYQDVYNDPKLMKSKQVKLQNVGTRARCVLCAPVLSMKDGKVLGVLEVINKRDTESHFDESDEKLALMMCSLVSRSIDEMCEDEEELLEFLD